MFGIDGIGRFERTIRHMAKRISKTTAAAEPAKNKMIARTEEVWDAKRRIPTKMDITSQDPKWPLEYEP